ncbi:MAG: ArsR family transcriptional regulator [Candidatus Micrarchaeia archaeon]
MDSIARLLIWLLEGTKGAKTRQLLLSLLLEKPRNMRQLALAAGMDYKSVQHHIELMEKNSIVSRAGGYSPIYFVSDIVLAEKGFVSKLKGGKHGKK